MDAYRALGVAPNASLQELKAAYRSCLLAYHPDHTIDLPKKRREAAAARFAEVQKAWALVGEPAARARYDLKRQVAQKRAEGQGRPRGPVAKAPMAGQGSGPPVVRDQAPSTGSGHEQLVFGDDWGEVLAVGGMSLATELVLVALSANRLLLRAPLGAFLLALLWKLLRGPGQARPTPHLKRDANCAQDAQARQAAPGRP